MSTNNLISLILCIDDIDYFSMTHNKDYFSLIIDSKLSYLPTGMLREPYEHQ